MNPVPVLETERLVLRGLRADDFEAYHALWSEPEVVRFTSGKALDREEAWRKMMAQCGMWVLAGFGYLAVTERGSGRLIGLAGVQDVKRNISPSLDGTMEAGWIFAPDAQGKGFAQEAMRAILSWCCSTHPSLPVSCIIADANTPSIRLAERLGFEEVARSFNRDTPIIVYRRR